ncbi:sensor histidine kinase [Hymenobacter sp. HMF4947]|uniref:Sensor histidine kinase n=1 Tax=Hymenobacter ginkgonis TaxID=2682976 RepID=A0A7K1THB4_9BACT|nr:histidine kinase [Hymenobacter ginkgonis]MVN77571.1 sensor histidine kinase [Hymenobacter ginkgonis]
MKLFLQPVFQALGMRVRAWQFGGVAALYWGSFALAGYVQSNAYWLLRGDPSFTGTEELELLLRGLLWLLSTPLILYLAYRAPITSFRPLRRWGRNLGLHLAVQFGLNLLITCLSYLVLYRLLGLTPGRTWGYDGVWASMLLRLTISLTTYLLLVFGYGLATVAYRNQTLQHQNVRYELANEQLKTQLAGAQLQALKMQLNPHFLFNAHHSLVGLILEHENERAIAMVTALSDLLRAVLVNGDAQLIPLREELQFVTKYLHIQKIRFQDRLHIDFAIAADTRECLFPQFLLQPLVENAMVHGIEQVIGTACLRIAAHREGEQLVVEVSDDAAAAGRRPAATGQGIGLSNTKARLEKLYHGQAQLEFVQPPTGGTVVRLRVPQNLPATLPTTTASPILVTV